MIPISGFTIVRNARILNYPFEESVRSVLPLVSEFIISCGQSDDDTLEICRSLQKQFPEKIKLVESFWERKEQSGGFQLRYQTDRALALTSGRWCFYIQADEVIHQDDLPRIRESIKRADADERVDGVVFDYLHFYVSYNYEIRGRNWYRREVRAFKNGRGISSFRDAQGFRKNNVRLKAIRSNARIFHYGYVRTPDSLKMKSIEMSQWWGEAPSIQDRDNLPCNHVGLRRFTQSHPADMNARITDYNFEFDPRQSPRKWNRDEIKNLLTLAWELVFPFRIGEFRNYDL
jgi:hypothetical protein